MIAPHHAGGQFEPPLYNNAQEEIPGEEHREDNHTMAGLQESVAQSCKDTRHQEHYFLNKSNSRSQDTVTAWDITHTMDMMKLNSE